MKYISKSIRSFIGARDFEESRRFYNDLGFNENVINPTMSYFEVGVAQGFYLQKYYVKKWVDNSMLFLEVDDLDVCYKELTSLGLQNRYKFVRFTEIKTLDWGREFFMHDPSGILWHFGIFNG